MEKYLFTFEWESNTINHHITKWLHDKGIDYHYDTQVLKADLYRIGKIYKFDYEQIEGNLFGIIAIEA